MLADATTAKTKKPNKTQKKPKKPMPNLRFKGSVWFFWDCYTPIIHKHFTLKFK
jgi:hypothetical protein